MLLLVQTGHQDGTARCVGGSGIYRSFVMVGCQVAHKGPACWWCPIRVCLCPSGSATDRQSPLCTTLRTTFLSTVTGHFSIAHFPNTNSIIIDQSNPAEREKTEFHKIRHIGCLMFSQRQKISSVFYCLIHSLSLQT